MDDQELQPLAGGPPRARPTERKAPDQSGERQRMVIFMMITLVFLLLSFRASTTVLNNAAKTTLRIRHEQARTELLMMKLVANYSARLDAAKWKGGSGPPASTSEQIQTLETEVRL